MAAETTPPALTRAEDARALIARIMALKAELLEVLDRETQSLRRGRAGDLAGLQARKSALTAAFAHEMATLKANAAFVKTAVPAEVATLKAEHEELARSLAANQEAIVAIKAVSERLLLMVSEKVADARGQLSTYGKTGAASAYGRKPASIAIDGKF